MRVGARSADLNAKPAGSDPVVCFDVGEDARGCLCRHVGFVDNDRNCSTSGDLAPLAHAM